MPRLFDGKTNRGKPGRKRGVKNKKTLILERVYQRCMARGFHPADFIMDCLDEAKLPLTYKIDTAFRLLGYMEGTQPESRPIIPTTPADSAQRAKETMQELEALSEPLEPKPQP